MPNKKFHALILFAVTVVLILASSMAHCTTSAPRPNSLGLDQVYTNPNVYLFAVPVQLAVIQGQGDHEFYTAVRFQPYNTMELYDESVLFCGDVSGDFRRVPMVVTYDRQAHKMFKGIACHELQPIFEIKTEEQP
jgi:hypothetical protein